jgi:hypothetical protein
MAKSGRNDVNRRRVIPPYGTGGIVCRSPRFEGDVNAGNAVASGEEVAEGSARVRKGVGLI